jgi:Kef-type K+ transport system membrane component KefB
MEPLLHDIGVSILAATLCGALFHVLRQPVILGYLAAGALIGPAMGLRLVTETGNIEVISEIGLVLLLFIIGLELQPHKIISSGKQLLVAGIGQFLLCALLGAAVFGLAGFSLARPHLDAVYLALLCGMSSTAIVVKLLYDKREMDTLPGRVTLGVLIFQDVWAILILALQPNLTNPQVHLVLLALLKSAGLLAAAFALSAYVLRRLYQRLANSPEMVVSLSIAWCAFVATVAELMGMSKEMGALIAGVAVSTFPYSVHVTAKVLPLRDFFLTLFFLSVGMKVPAPHIGMALPVLGIVVFVIASRLITVYPLLMASGSGRRTSFITSINLAQISEFSLVIAALGVGYGHIGENVLTLVTYSMAATAVLSSYLIKGNHGLFLAFDGLMRRIGRGAGRLEQADDAGALLPSVVLLGCHRGGQELVNRLAVESPRILPEMLAIDFNTEVLAQLKRSGVRGMFGDLASSDTLYHGHVQHASIILCTIPDMLLKGTTNLHLVRTCRQLAPKAVIVATAETPQQAEQLIAAGADRVIEQYGLVGEQAAELVRSVVEA